MRTLVIFTMFLLASGSLAAQERAKERLQKAKKEYVVRRLGLTNEQEKTFVPLYEEYIKKQQDINTQIRRLKIETNTLALSDEELNADVDKLLELKQKDLDMEKEYLRKFRTILTVKQVVEIYRAEKDFVKVVLKGLRDRE